MKKDLGSVLALYPMPATIVGAMVDGKPNWLQVAHVGVIGHDRVMVSSMKAHYTNKGIRDTGVLSISLADVTMLEKLDLAGMSSGAKTDKSQLFAWSAAENGAPVPNEAPLTLACTVVDDYETEKFDNFILRIDSTLVDEMKLDERGKIDYAKVAPVLFEFPTYSYYALGEKLGACLSFGKAAQAE